MKQIMIMLLAVLIIVLLFLSGCEEEEMGLGEYTALKYSDGIGHELEENRLLFDQATADPTLLDDSEWKDEVLQNLEDMKQINEEFYVVLDAEEYPREDNAIFNALAMLSNDIHLYIENMEYGIANKSPDHVFAGRGNIADANTRFKELEETLQKRKEE